MIEIVFVQQLMSSFPVTEYWLVAPLGNIILGGIDLNIVWKREYFFLQLYNVNY